MDSVTITVTNRKTGDTYKARSYPDDDKDNDGVIEFYSTPVYFIDIKSKAGTKTWKAVRFMPYWNDPAAPDPGYRARGFLNSGLHKFPKQAVSLYLPNYPIHNRYSPHKGAIQIRNNFLVHAGPSNLSDIGWGSAGCVEVIGDFGQFKRDIRNLAGINAATTEDAALSNLVRNKKLFIELEYDTPPIFLNHRVSP